MRLAISLLAVAAALTAFSAPAQTTTQTIREESVRAHEAFLASDALRGRGSATPDEAVAAAYVASQFQGYGLVTAPGMDGYLQTATVLRPKLSGHAALSSESVSAEEGRDLTLIYSGGKAITGTVVLATSDDPKAMPDGDIILVTNPGAGPMRGWSRAAAAHHARLVVFRQSADTDKTLAAIGGQTTVSSFLQDMPPANRRSDIAVLSARAFDLMSGMAGHEATLDTGGAEMASSTTTNAIGYLPGSDPTAGVILITAHIDHLGVVEGGTIMHGANDDASGTVAVLEIAEAMAKGPKPKRGILFVGYGSEEIGGLGSTWFGAHPPIPLSDIVTNLEFEMIGAQDPKMAPGVMMMTGFDRSNLGETLQSKGAAVAPDLYPDEHFFERSDNYSLALQGIVAHTISGWAVTPTYHDPSDDIAHIDFPFMTKAIQSLIVPVEYLANSDFKPEWKGEGRPK